MQNELETAEKKRAEKMKQIEAEFNGSFLKVSKNQKSVVTQQQFRRPADNSIGAQLAFYFPHDRQSFAISA